MPKKPMDYSKTIIYKIVCKDDNIKDCYVGHTTSFVKRKNSHKSCCNNENNNYYGEKLYSTIRENGGWDNWDMIEIERYDCKDVYEARKYEYKWIKDLNAKLNYRLPYDKEEKECRKERGKEIDKKKYEKNKQKILEKNKEKIECECGSIIRKSELARHKRTNKHIDYLEKTQ